MRATCYAELAQAVEELVHVLEIPDIATVDHAENKHIVVKQAMEAHATKAAFAARERHPLEPAGTQTLGAGGGG